MESILNEMNGMLEDVNDAFEKWKSLRPKIKKLLKYYESPAWFRDVDASNSWEIPENISHWVLSEDAAWNAFVFEYWLAKEFQKLTKQVLIRYFEVNKKEDYKSSFLLSFFWKILRKL